MVGFPCVAETGGCPFAVEATDEATPFVPFAMNGVGLAGAAFERLCANELRSSFDRLGGTGGVGLTGAGLERLCVDELRSSLDRLGGTGEGRPFSIDMLVAAAAVAFPCLGADPCP